MHELVPETPLRHGHAISIDMAYSSTLAHMRGMITDEEYHRLLNLFSRAGLSIDHPQFDEDILDKGTKAILRTRDGKLRLAVPNPIGNCVFLNDVSQEEMTQALRKHKEVMKQYPRNGDGLEAYVDASDTGYTEGNETAVEELAKAASEAGNLNGSMNGKHVNGGIMENGHNGTDSIKSKLANGDKGVTNGTNGFTNGAKA